jgi:hypothetical protein
VSLVWQDAGGTGARTHAFVIGIGAYPHIAAGTLPGLGLNARLSQLTSPPASAKKVVDWLRGNANNLKAPLGSIELLLSPTETVIDETGTPVAVADATMTNITQAFGRWDRLCHNDRGNVALFYFCGHGIAREDQVLLASDFGDPLLGNVWSNAIDFSSTHVGMSACNAETQLYFIDACRETPMSVLEQLRINATSLKSGTFRASNRDAPIYWAATPGTQGMGIAGQPSFFSEAMVDALNGVAAVNMGGGWEVTTASLGNGIKFRMAELAQEHGLPIESRTGGEVGMTPIHGPADVQVRVNLDCSPVAARAGVEMVVQNLTSNGPSLSLRPVPHRTQVPPGMYELRAQFSPAGGFEPSNKSVLIVPPGFSVSLECKPVSP